MKNKKLISLIIGALIIAGIIIALGVRQNEINVSDIASNCDVENEIQNATEDITEESNNIQEDIVLVSDNEMTLEEDTIQQNSVSSKTEEQKQIVKATQEKQVESPKQQEGQRATQIETKIATQKQETQIQEQQQIPKSETNIQQPETPKCTDTKHAVGVGNSNKWFSTKSEAISYYNSQISYWGNLWENFEVDDDVYYKNCPTRI